MSALWFIGADALADWPVSNAVAVAVVCVDVVAFEFGPDVTIALLG